MQVTDFTELSDALRRIGVYILDRTALSGEVDASV